MIAQTLSKPEIVLNSQAIEKPSEPAKNRQDDYYDGCFDSLIGLPIQKPENDDYLAGYFSTRPNIPF